MQKEEEAAMTRGLCGKTWEELTDDEEELAYLLGLLEHIRLLDMTFPLEQEQYAKESVGDQVIRDLLDDYGEHKTGNFILREL